jgi:beta-1,2-xylosyltransferase
LLSLHASDRQLVPILSLASTKHHADLLVPAVGVEGRIERVGSLDVPWEDKSERLYWRGSATGMYNHAPPRGSNESPRWLNAHRPRLSHFANSLDGEGVQPVALAVDGTTGRMAVGPSAVGWKARWLDVHLASTGWWRWFAWWPETGQQCSWWDGTCRRLGREFAYVGKDPAGTADGHRFALDVDGNAWSARFPRLMASRGLPLKATAFDEWNAGLFPTWLGYVPLNNDYSDLESVLALYVWSFSSTSVASGAVYR